MDTAIFKDVNVASINGMVIRVDGSPSVGPGHNGQALHFDDTSQILSMDGQPDNCLGNITLCHKGFTFSFWLHLNEFYYNEYTNVLNAGGQRTVDTFGILIFIENSKDLIAIRVKTQDTVLSYYQPIDKVPRGSWNHWTFSWTVQNGIILYQNGCFKSQRQDEDTREGTASSKTPATIIFGHNLNGSLDEVYLYAHEMSAEQVFMLYNR